MQSCRRAVYNAVAVLSVLAGASVSVALDIDAKKAQERAVTAAKGVVDGASDSQVIRQFFANLDARGPEGAPASGPGEIVPFMPRFDPFAGDAASPSARWLNVPALQGGYAALIRALKSGRAESYQPMLRDPLVDEQGRPATYDPWCVAIARLPDDPRTGKVSWCSGVVIAPNAILTARHCCSVYKDRRDAGRVRRGRGPGGMSLARFAVVAGQTITAQDAVMVNASHPQFIGKAGGNAPCENASSHDIAVILFESDLPSAFQPIRIAPKNTLDAYLGPRGNAIRVVGYGLANPLRDQPESIALGTQFSAWVSGTVQLCTPGQPAQPWLRACEEDQFMVSPTLNGIASAMGADSCRGDSGGAAVIEIDGVPLLVGLVHGSALAQPLAGGMASCGQGGVYTRVDRYIDWLVNTASYEPPGADPERSVRIRWSPSAPPPPATAPQERR
jgi:hypothetical protein